MTIEQVRERLRAKLEDTYGVDETAILMDRPPGGWSELATRRDLDALESRMDRRFTELEAKLDLKLAKFEAKLDKRISDSFARQTRWLFTALVMSLGVLGGGIIAAIRL